MSCLPWQRRYRYILIDEFQDINRLQYEIVRMLAKPEDNLFIVGDDDQSIYRFRGAKPEIMLGFERDYPGAGRILLDVNYRSTEEIVAPALRLIGENQKRFSKAIHTTGRHGKNVITKLWQDPGKKIWPLPGDTAVSAVGSAAGGYRSFIPDQCWSSFSDGKADGIQPSFPDKGYGAESL
ncbi:MAG: UvrD-helicase domain-containing protein [Clostridium fessum]